MNGQNTKKKKVFAEMSQPSVLSLLEARWRVEVASRVRDSRLPYLHESGISQRDGSRMTLHLRNVEPDERSRQREVGRDIVKFL